MINIGDVIDTGRLVGRVESIDTKGVHVRFTEDKDYHMSSWLEVYVPAEAERLIKETKRERELWQKRQNEKAQKNAAKRQTKLLLKLPKHYVKCTNCKMLLSYDPANVETAFTGVEFVHCFQCGAALRPDRGW